VTQGHWYHDSKKGIDPDMFDVIDQLRGLVLVPPFVIPILSVCLTVTSQSSMKMVRDRPKRTITLYQLDP